MNTQRVFWISGAATLLVLILIGAALVARSEVPEANPTTVLTGMTSESESEMLRKELAQAYADLDQAYRTIEQLQQGSVSRDRHHDDDDDHDDHDHDEDHDD